MLADFQHNEGILLVNKPLGLSSFAVVKAAKRALNIKKAGHAGTLDPLASGLMIVGTGRYTKLLGYLSDCDKSYDVTVRFGVQTTTDDSEGAVVSETPVPNFSETEIKERVAAFVGPIMQVPPKFSAIKVSGERAYALSRKEAEFTLKPRALTIYSISIERIELPYVALRVHCQKGTYMRSLARDLGESLKVGAHACSITRIAIGNIKLEEALSLENVTEQHLLKGRHGLRNFSLIDVDQDEALDLRNGKPIKAREEDISGEAIAVCGDHPIAVVKKIGQSLCSVRGI